MMILYLAFQNKKVMVHARLAGLRRRAKVDPTYQVEGENFLCMQPSCGAQSRGVPVAVDDWSLNDSDGLLTPESASAVVTLLTGCGSGVAWPPQWACEGGVGVEVGERRVFLVLIHLAEIEHCDSPTSSTMNAFRQTAKIRQLRFLIFRYNEI